MILRKPKSPFPDNPFLNLLRLSLLLVLAAAPARVLAQSTFHITGTVLTFNGKPVANAHITAKNEETGETTIATSAEDGTYALDLMRGDYLFTASSIAGSIVPLPVKVPLESAASTLDLHLRAPQTAARPPDSARPGTSGEASAATNHAGGRPMESPIHVDSVGSDDVPASTGHRQSARDFLIRGKSEEPGFGLYSYILIPSRSTDADTQRDIAVIGSFLKALDAVSDVEAFTAKSKINVTYLVVKSGPAATAEAVLADYDVPRCKHILELFAADHADVSEGPYIVSTLAPLGDASQLPAHYLWQDLSSVQPDVAAAWEKEFEKQAGQPEFWQASTRDAALLKLRNFISTAASGGAAVAAGATVFQDGLKKFLSWK